MPAYCGSRVSALKHSDQHARLVWTYASPTAAGRALPLVSSVPGAPTRTESALGRSTACELPSSHAATFEKPADCLLIVDRRRRTRRGRLGPAVDGGVLQAAAGKGARPGPAERNTTYFLPMVMRETSSGGRRRQNLYPLVCLLSLPARRRGRTAGGAQDQSGRAIRRRGRRPTADISPRDRDAGNGAADLPETVELYAHLAVGTRVLVKAGPLKGSRASCCNTSSGTSCGWA